jgi:hypothetical protein
VQIQREKVEFRHKHPTFLPFKGTYRGGFLRNSLRLRHGPGIIALEFHWSPSVKVSKRAEVLFVNPNGKSEFIVKRSISCKSRIAQ